MYHSIKGASSCLLLQPELQTLRSRLLAWNPTQIITTYLPTLLLYALLSRTCKVKAARLV